LGDFNETFRLLFVYAHLQYPNIKYTIFDRPHNLGMGLCESSLKLLITEWIIEISQSEKKIYEV
jgi:hypothetical protein